MIGRNINVNYSGIMKNDTVKQKIGDLAGKTIKKTIFGGSDVLRKVVEDTAGSVAEFAVGIAPELAERKAISVIEQRENRGRLLNMAEQVLEKRGLCIKLEDFVFVQETFSEIQDEVIVKDARERKFELSPALEEELLGAVAGYLKMLLKE
ncbi:MAG: hypothetical protein NC318_10890 [Blautia sp.]|nr:hypothetical protein [Lachnoclostridium sp.]MCM1212099.1 hypothetical protein [Blautia sp.]